MAFGNNYSEDRAPRVGSCRNQPPAGAIRSMPVTGEVKQVATFTADSASDAVYTLEIKPAGEARVTITFDEGAAGTVGSKATGLAQAINVSASLAQHVVASVSSADVIVTALQGGVGFTATESDGKLSLVQTTANAASPRLRFGTAAVLDYGTSGDKSKVTDPNEDDATAKVMTVTPANVTNAEQYSIVIRGDLDGDGEIESYSCPPYSSAAAASAGNMCNHFTQWAEATLPANSIGAVDGATLVTFTAQIAGLDFQIHGSVAHDLDADAAPTGSLAIATSTANVPHEFAGVVGASDAVDANDGDAGYVKGSVPAPIIGKSPVLLRLDDDVTSIAMNDPVGFRVNADGADEVLGTFRNAASGTDIAILLKSRAQWFDGVIHTDIDGNLGAYADLK